MELDKTVQVTIKELQTQQFDLFISASGYETRSIFLAQRIPADQAKRKVTFAFTERCEEISRRFNDKVYEQLNFEVVTASAASSRELIAFLEGFCRSVHQPEINVLVDYSSMPKLWYEAIIEFFTEHEGHFQNVHVWFSYTPSEYAAATSNVSNKYFQPEVPVLPTTKPIALLIGLGYEKGRAEDLAKKLKAQVTYLFYSDPAVDPRFVSELLDNNKNLLKNLDTTKTITYPIYDLNYINTSLTKLCIDLRLSHQIVLAPIGPKPFTLMCFLLNARYPDIKLWRIMSGIQSNPTDRKPHGELLIYKLLFTSEDVEYDE